MFGFVRVFSAFQSRLLALFALLKFQARGTCFRDFDPFSRQKMKNIAPQTINSFGVYAEQEYTDDESYLFGRKLKSARVFGGCGNERVGYV